MISPVASHSVLPPMLAIINPHAGGGRVEMQFEKLKRILVEAHPAIEVIMAPGREEIHEILEKALEKGIRHVIGVGGDGTHHAILNDIMTFPDNSFIYGTLPIGTGHDWSRSLHVPNRPAEAIRWLLDASPVSCDLGYVTVDGTQEESSHFINVVSAGITGEVDRRVNRLKHKNVFSYLLTSLAALARYRPTSMTVTCDGTVIHEGPLLFVAAANGRFFGGGMQIAPNALIGDGQLDVVVVESVPILRALIGFPRLFRGTHLNLPYIKNVRASEITITASGGGMKLDMDGEEGEGSEMTITVRKAAFLMMIHPETAPIR